MSTSDEATGPARRRRHVVHGLAAYAVLCAGTGIVGGALWRAIVRLPQYRLDATNHALIAERGLAAIFSMDAWFALIGAVIGVIIGGVAWQFFRRLAWRVVIIAVLGAVLAALVCWGVGILLDPGPLEERLAAAQPGDYVPINLQLHAFSALALWPFGAVLPIFLMSSLMRVPREERSGDDSAAGRSVASSTTPTPAPVSLAEPRVGEAAPLAGGTERPTAGS